MTFTLIQKIFISINTLIVLGFGWYFVQDFNAEFVAYVGSIAIISIVLYGTLHITKFGNGVLAGISAWALMHMLGGSVQTADGVLYAWRIFPFFDGGGEFYILKFDQFVHAFLYGVVGIMFLHLLREFIGIKTHTTLVAFIAICASAGFSIFNEIIEFSAVVILPETGVGGYFNTVLDLIFNLAGAAIAVVGYMLISRKGA